MCLQDDQKIIDEKTERDAMCAFIAVACAFTLFGAIVGFIGGYAAKSAVYKAAQVQVD